MPVASGSIAFLGAARFQGYWNASTNTGTGSIYGGITGEVGGEKGLFESGSSPGAGYQVESGLTASKGDYWQVTGSGAHNVDGDTSWSLNDFCIFSGSVSGQGSWTRLAFEDTVASIILGDMTSSSFHLGTGSDGHVIFGSGSIHSGSSDFVYQYLTGKLGVPTVSASAGNFATLSGSTVTAHALTVSSFSPTSVSASSGQFATLSGSAVTAYDIVAVAVSGTTMTPHTVNLGQGGLAGPAATVSASAGTFAVLSGSIATVHGATAVNVVATTVSGTTMTPHTVNLGQGGLAGPAATVSASAGTFAVLSGSAVTLNNLTLSSVSGSRAGPGSYLAVSSAGLVVLEEAGGTITAVANGVNNRVATFGSADTLNGEIALQFDGSSLVVQGAVNANIVSNAAALASDTIVATGYNSLMLGPITVNAGIVLTIQAGAVLKIKDISDI